MIWDSHHAAVHSGFLSGEGLNLGVLSAGTPPPPSVPMVQNSPDPSSSPSVASGDDKDPGHHDAGSCWGGVALLGDTAPRILDLETGHGAHTQASV